MLGFIIILFIIINGFLLLFGKWFSFKILLYYFFKVSFDINYFIYGLIESLVWDDVLYVDGLFGILESRSEGFEKRSGEGVGYIVDGCLSLFC